MQLNLDDVVSNPAWIGKTVYVCAFKDGIRYSHATMNLPATPCFIDSRDNYDRLSMKQPKVPLGDNILLRYSKEGDLILDQFVGGGTTLVEAKLLKRNIIGVDINDAALTRCKEKIAFKHEGADGKVLLYKGDARNLDFISDESIDLICSHPPYANIIQYS